MAIIGYYFLWITLGLLALIVLYVLAAILLPYIGVGKAVKQDASRLIYLDGNGIHIDLIFAKSELPDEFLEQLTPGADAKYMAFGWGDRGFYLDTPTWAELKMSVALKAAFVPSPTLMHVVDHKTTLPDWRAVRLSEAQFQSILQHVKDGFYKSPETKNIKELPDTGYTDNDRFYLANGQYFFLYTCNTWVNEGLKNAGVRTAIWAVHENALFHYFPEKVIAS